MINTEVNPGFMNKGFDKVCQFRITLKGTAPPVWRRIQVPGNYTFWDLHVAIQDAMGWSDYHLHRFDFLHPPLRLRLSIGLPDETDARLEIRVLPDWEQRILDHFSPGNDTMNYTYDFGDDWEHSVKLEKVLPREKGVDYPRLIKGKGACPPEDCGGVWSFEQQCREGSIDRDDFDVEEMIFTDPRKRLKAMLAAREGA